MRTVAFAVASLSVMFVPWSPQGPSDELDPETRDRAVEELAELVEANYIFPEVAAQIAEHLHERHLGGAYDAITDTGTLASVLTVDLRSVNDDRHLGVRALRPEDLARPEADPAARRARMIADARRRNFGFQKVEILDDNVGYLDLRGFIDAGVGGDTAVAAMGFLANVDALIIDLRNNGGGDPSMIQLLCSYFFEEPKHLNSFQHRGSDELQQFWTLPHVPGKKLIDVPLYVLTSARTFSAAEEFTYDLKNLQRATIVGETTGGGAHPGESHPIAGRFTVFIPDGRAVNPITGTNWEGTGVAPDIDVRAAEAFDAALAEARKRVGGKGEAR